MIYTSARWADEAHKMVIGTDAEGNIETVPADYTLFRQPEHGPLGFLANGGEIEEYVAPEPATPVSKLNGGGLSRFSGASPIEVYESIGLGSVTRIAKGRFRVGLESEIASGFSPMPFYVDTNPRNVWVSAVTSSYVEVRARDLAGAAADCQQIIVKVERVVTQ